MRDITKISNEELLRLSAEIRPQTSVTEIQLTSPQPFVRSPVEVIPEFTRGAIAGGREVVSGGLQTAADIAGALFPDSPTITSFRQLLPEAITRGRQRFQAQVPQTVATQVGQFVGEAAPFAATIPAASPTLAARTALGALGGAIAAGTAPTEQQLPVEEALEERAGLATLGGAIGSVVPGAVSAVGS